MKKDNQTTTNPYPYSDTNKRYYTYDYYLKQTFGGKCAKIPLDAGMTCPNIDGRCSTGGCIYCSGRGSGDFAAAPTLSIEEQYEQVRQRLSHKWSVDKCIPYFQAHTNTYAPLPRLRSLFEAAINLPGAVGLNVATRADCLEPDVLEYLSELSERTILTIELGLQSAHDRTADLINRGHTWAQFCQGYENLRAANKNIHICVHLIFGLPGETREDMLTTVRCVAALRPHQVKIHLLHVLQGTSLADMYLVGEYEPMDRQDYIETVAEALTLLPSDTVIGRLTGDGMAEQLLAPEWSRRKVSVINDIDKLLFLNGWYQGIHFDNEK